MINRSNTYPLHGEFSLLLTWKLRCRKGVRGCGAKHISKSKRTKRTIIGAFWEFKLRCSKCTQLWPENIFRSQHGTNGSVSEHDWKFGARGRLREAHFEVKMVQELHCLSDNFFGS